MNKNYYPGKGCNCYAHSESECCCDDVDWTDPEVYKLRAQVTELQKWKDAIEEQLEICGLESLHCKDDPKQLLYHLIQYQMEGAYNEGNKEILDLQATQIISLNSTIEQLRKELED